MLGQGSGMRGLVRQGEGVAGVPCPPLSKAPERKGHSTQPRTSAWGCGYQERFSISPSPPALPTAPSGLAQGQQPPSSHPAGGERALVPPTFVGGSWGRPAPIPQHNAAAWLQAALPHH